MRSERDGCPAAAALEVIGERWSLLVLRELFYGAHRFDRIVERTGALGATSSAPGCGTWKPRACWSAGSTRTPRPGTSTT